MVKHHDVVGRYVTIEVDDCEYKVFYLQNGKGIPLVCQHTAGCHNHQWRGLLEDEEITKNYNVIAYDLPRHGKSDPPHNKDCLLYTSPSPRDPKTSRMPSSA